MHTQYTSRPAILAQGLAAQLTALLEGHGLTVALRRDGTIDVRNPAGSATDPLGRALHPGLNQRITVIQRDDRFWWCWLWPGCERDAPPELEPMVPLEQIEEAARRLAVVLHVHESPRT